MVPGVSLAVVAVGADNEQTTAKFAEDVLKDVDCTLLSSESVREGPVVAQLVAEMGPEVLFISGWWNPAYRNLATVPKLQACPKALMFDTPFAATLRQKLARLRMRAYISRFDLVFVPGERAWQFGRYLGVPEGRIEKGLYGVEFSALARTAAARRAMGKWPRTFLFLGQYVPRKGVDILVEAYVRYRARVSEPWGLVCCGRGPLADILRDTPGIQDLGFVQPSDLPAVLRGSGALVLPSRSDAWPLAVVEGCAAGLPIICTAACGSQVELVRNFFNGIVVATEDVEDLVSAMVWAHTNHTKLPEMGARSIELARPFSADAWAKRVIEISRRVS